MLSALLLLNRLKNVTNNRQTEATRNEETHAAIVRILTINTYVSRVIPYYCGLMMPCVCGAMPCVPISAKKRAVFLSRV